MKKISIIGSNSFLAKNFIQFCKNNNSDYVLYLYDQKPSTDNDDVTLIDFNDLSSIKSINYDVDIVMIFIGKTGVLQELMDYVDCIYVNEIILLQILISYINNNSKAKIIYPSSRLIFKSDDRKKISEDSDIECKSIYAITKYSSENYLKVFANLYNIRYNILRICTTFGSLIDNDGNYGTFEMLKKQALNNKEITLFGDGKQRKTFTHLNDICIALKKIIDSNDTLYNDYNLGGQDLSMLDIAEYIAKQYNVPVKHIDWPDNFKKVDGGTVVFDSKRFDQEFNMNYRRIL